jgi:hypothetical protein
MMGVHQKSSHLVDAMPTSLCREPAHKSEPKTARHVILRLLLPKNEVVAIPLLAAEASLRITPDAEKNMFELVCGTFRLRLNRNLFDGSDQCCRSLPIPADICSPSAAAIFTRRGHARNVRTI